MNQQNSTPDTEPAKGSDVDTAAAASKAAAAKVADEQVTKDAAEKLPKGHKRVTLVHPATKAKVEVMKPSSDYTNFVRSYGYKEA